jgi:hypothetical protein
MKRFSAVPAIALACLCLSVVLVPAVASGAPSAYPFDGVWQGTFTGTVTAVPNDPRFHSPETEAVNIPVTTRVDSNYWASVDGKDSSGDTFGTYFGNGNVGSIQVPASGIITGLFPNIDLVGRVWPGSCNFSLQFSGNNLTSTPLDCQVDTDPGFPTGYLVTLTNASLRMTRTSGAPAPTPAPAPTSHEAVTVVAAVKGKGTLSGGAIKCPGSCRVTLTLGGKVTLTARPARGYHLKTWGGGACLDLNYILLKPAVPTCALTAKFYPGDTETLLLYGVIAGERAFTVPTDGTARVTAIFVKNG